MNGIGRTCNKNKPVITIIVPIYNVEPYLSKCIDSLLSQDYRPLDIILVDDCSTDNSIVIAERYARDNNDICTLLRREKNGGLSAARNSGMKLAKGDWITFVDSDDWVSEDYVSSLYYKALETNADIVLGEAEYVYANGVIKSARAFGGIDEKSSNKKIIALCKSYAWGRLYKASLLKKADILFPEDIKRSEDIGTIIPILTKAEKISLLNKTIYSYYQRSRSLSNSNILNDLSFYTKTVQRMFDLSNDGFEEELEFRAIHEMLYGYTYIMICSKKSIQEFQKHIESFNFKYPTWKQNKYIKYLPIVKRIFINMAGDNHYLAIKFMVKIRNIVIFR